MPAVYALGLTTDRVVLDFVIEINLNIVTSQGGPVNGEAHTFANQKDFAGALNATTQQHEREQVQRIIGTPELLAQQTLVWVQTHQSQHSDLADLWEQAVNQVAPVLGKIILQRAAELLEDSRLLKQKLSLIPGHRDVLYAHPCPFCGQDMRLIKAMTPEDFQQRESLPFSLEQLKPRKCDHGLPITAGDRQVISNEIYLASLTEGQTGQVKEGGETRFLD
jgi:hypothetical protein